MVHQCSSTWRYFWPWYEYCIYCIQTSYCNIYDAFPYASTNMGKHCLQLELILLPLFNPYARQFSKQTDEKYPYWAVFSVIQEGGHNKHSFQLGLSAVPTSEPTTKTWGNTLLVLLLHNVSYRVSYRDNCIGIRIVDRGKMYHCRPTLGMRLTAKQRVFINFIFCNH